ncbi:MAG: hypothetical protein ACP5VS_02335 [Desulfomonilaceae bacterium]
MYDVVEPESGRNGCPRKKGARLPALKSIFNNGDTKWVCNRTKMYGHETTILVYRFKAIWYRAAGNEPLSIVLVRDPVGKYPGTAFFDADSGASDIATIQRYTHRWGAEITNRETQFLLGSADRIPNAAQKKL